MGRGNVEVEVNPIEESMILHCQERLSKNQFDLTVRKDERFLLDLHLTVSQFHCLRPCAIALPGVALACKRSAIGGNK